MTVKLINPEIMDISPGDIICYNNVYGRFIRWGYDYPLVYAHVKVNGVYSTYWKSYHCEKAFTQLPVWV